MSREYVHIDDWQLLEHHPNGNAIKVDNGEHPFLESYEPNPDYQIMWLPASAAEIREDDELWVQEWLAIERGMV